MKSTKTAQTPPTPLYKLWQIPTTYWFRMKVHHFTNVFICVWTCVRFIGKLERENLLTHSPNSHSNQEPGHPRTRGWYCCLPGCVGERGKKLRGQQTTPPSLYQTPAPTCALSVGQRELYYMCYSKYTNNALARTWCISCYLTGKQAELLWLYKHDKLMMQKDTK